MGQPLRRLRETILGHQEDRSDADLVRAYVRGRDEAAFSAMVFRHGPMVWGVCRRVAGHHQDAEDAFQATFLTLARRAETVSPPGLVANWLYGVACRTARKARAVGARRAFRERQVVALPDPAVEEAEPEGDFWSVLDRELGLLSDKYRVAVVLCDLEGKTHKEAARLIGCPEGTLSARLSRARSALAARLSRRGVVLSAGVLGVALARGAAAAAPPPGLTSSAINFAAVVAAGESAIGAIPAAVCALSGGGTAVMMTKRKATIAAVLMITATAAGMVAARTTLPVARAVGRTGVDPSKSEPIGLLPFAVSTAPAPNPGPPRLLVASSNRTGNWEIYLMDPDTREAKKLTNNQAIDTAPAWSPDGKRIAFVSDRRGPPELWVMDADGGRPQPVSRDTAGCSWLRWSPDGTRIAFVIEKEWKGDLFSVEVATGKVTRLTAEEFACGEPEWSPDGKKVAYSYFQEKTPKWSLYTMNADGSGKRDVGGAGGGTEAAWSPDGKRIAFTSLRDDQGFRLYTADPEGRDVRSLGTAPAPSIPLSPRWSPDGKTIAFRDWDQAGQMCQVAVVGADGAGYKVLTATAPHAHPRWSPDGKSLSYGRFEDAHGYFRERQTAVLIVSDADGKNPRELLRGYGGEEWRPR